MGKIYLIIDDDPSVRNMNKKLLQSIVDSPAPILLNNGLEALKYLDANYSRKNMYFILLDIEMPLMNGWEFLNSINLEFPDGEFKVIVSSTSSYLPNPYRQKFYKQVSHYCGKPLEADLLKSFKTYHRVKSKT